MRARASGSWKQFIRSRDLVKGSAMPPEHRWQVHGTMFVGDLDKVVLSLFYRGMPVAPKFEVGATCWAAGTPAQSFDAGAGALVGVVELAGELVDQHRDALQRLHAALIVAAALVGPAELVLDLVETILQPGNRGAGTDVHRPDAPRKLGDRARHVA